MIGYLRGRVLEHSDGKATLIVGPLGEEGAVGYSVTVPQSSNYENLSSRKTVEFFIYTHVREDSLDLYGFASKTEKALFLTLLSVNGIGPKGAMTILSGIEPNSLIQAILQADKETLVKIPGIGKKTAERVVLELAEPLRKKFEMGLLENSQTFCTATPQIETQILTDAKEALLSLGYRESDIVTALKRTYSAISSPPRVDNLVRLALKHLSQRTREAQ